MPEGDSVLRSCRRLHQALAGQVLVDAQLRVPRHATADLRDHTVLEVVARGKHQLFRLSEGLTLHTHLRMDGTWRYVSPGQRWPGPPHHLRVRLVTSTIEVLGFLLGEVDLVPTEHEQRLVGHLGPDLLGPDWDADLAVERLRADPNRSIGEALLDQRNLAGIGTIFRAETLFMEKVNPRTPVGAVPELRAVVDRAQRLLSGSVEGCSTTGSSRRDHRFWVYGRSNRPCRRCGTLVLTEEFGPVTQERLSYWCPSCQLLPPELPVPDTPEPRSR